MKDTIKQVIKLIIGIILMIATAVYFHAQG